MAHYVGNGLYAHFVYSGGTVVLNTDYRTLDDNRTIENVDTSAGADTWKSHVVTLRDGTIDFTYVDDNSAGTAIKRALVIGTAGTLVYGPQGTAVGMPKYASPVTVMDVQRPYKFNEAVITTVKFQRNGAPTLDYDSNGDVW